MKKNMNRVTGICLGVIDMKKSLQFYRDKLGFKTDETGDNPDVVFFCTPGTKLELYPLDLLAKDIDPGNPPAPGSGFGGITLAYKPSRKRKLWKSKRACLASIISPLVTPGLTNHTGWPSRGRRKSQCR